MLHNACLHVNLCAQIKGVMGRVFIGFMSWVGSVWHCLYIGWILRTSLFEYMCSSRNWCNWQSNQNLNSRLEESEEMLLDYTSENERLSRFFTAFLLFFCGNCRPWNECIRCAKWKLWYTGFYSMTFLLLNIIRLLLSCTKVSVNLLFRLCWRPFGSQERK